MADLLTENPTDAVGPRWRLADRIRFEADVERRRFRLTVPIAFDRLISVVLPEVVGYKKWFRPHRQPNLV